MPRARPRQGAHQGQRPQAGDRGVQIVAPRSITAWRVVAGPRRRGQRARRAPRIARLRGRERRLDARRAAPSPARRCRRRRPRAGRRRSPRSPRRCRGRCRGARQPRLAVGEAAAVVAGHGAGAGEEVAGAGVVAEPGPGGHHLGVGGGGERRRPSASGRRRSRNRLHRRDRRLLQHHFGEPDAVGVGPARRDPGGTRQGRRRAVRSYQASRSAAMGLRPFPLTSHAPSR